MANNLIMHCIWKWLKVFNTASPQVQALKGISASAPESLALFLYPLCHFFHRCNCTSISYSHQITMPTCLICANTLLCILKIGTHCLLHYIPPQRTVYPKSATVHVSFVLFLFSTFYLFSLALKLHILLFSTWSTFQYLLSLPSLKSKPNHLHFSEI